MSKWRQGCIGTMGTVVLAGGSLLCSRSSPAQTPFGADPTQSNGPVLPAGRDNLAASRPIDPLESQMAARVKLEQNISRQKRLVSDTARLLALANELKTEAAGSGSETLTPEMLRKMDEIERLARSVKDKMRD